jgi:hypothetical protein
MGKKTVLPPKPPFTIAEYEKSPYWRAKSKAILDRKDIECEMCHRKRWKWQPRAKKWKRILRFGVHHITYQNVPNENDSDMMVLCYLCHSTSHLILRIRQISEMFERMAKIVEEYFKYDKDSYKGK